MSEVLAPIVLVCLAIGFGCLAAVAYNEWKCWEQPQAWRSKYGRVPPRGR